MPWGMCGNNAAEITRGWRNVHNERIPNSCYCRRQRKVGLDDRETQNTGGTAEKHAQA